MLAATVPGRWDEHATCSCSRPTFFPRNFYPKLKFLISGSSWIWEGVAACSYSAALHSSLLRFPHVKTSHKSSGRSYLPSALSRFRHGENDQMSNACSNASGMERLLFSLGLELSFVLGFRNVSLSLCLSLFTHAWYTLFYSRVRAFILHVSLARFTRGATA